MNTPRRILLTSITLLLGATFNHRCLAQDADASALSGVSGDDGALQAQSPMSLEVQTEPEKFVPSPAVDIKNFTGGTLVLRGDATVTGSAVQVKSICRWPGGDAAFFAPVADLTITQISGARPYATVTLDQVRATLRGAGMNLALVSFSGAMSCAVNRDGNAADEQAALADWVDSHQAIAASATDFPASGALPTALNAGAPSVEKPAINSLRAILTSDICRRMQIEPDAIEMTFNSADEKVLNLAEPYFRFEVTPRRVRTLGDLSWEVTVVSHDEKHKTTIAATARVWQTETILANPLAYQQIIREEDVTEKRVLTEQLPDEPLLTRTQAIGQAAARNLKPGITLTSSMVDPALLARAGQIITVNVVHGSMKVTAVAKALESGSYGQTIRARNDVDPTRLFEVTLTGPQEGTVTNEVGTDHQNNLSPIAAAAAN